ncbi:MAG: ATP-grasp domain-containing protein [Flavobacteriales bacterium]
MSRSIQKIQELGYEVFCADMNPMAPAFAFADGSAAVNISDVEGVGNYADEIGADVVLALNDAGVLPAAYANKKRGLKCYDPEEVKYFTDKGYMRQRWKEHGVAQPAFEICTTAEEIARAIHTIGFPCIVKPCMMWGSRGVSKVNNPDDIPFATQFAMENAKGARYIVEEFMQGVEVSIEGLFKDGKAYILAKADKELQQHDNYRVTIQINYEADLPPAILEEIDTLVAGAGKAMGFVSGALHAECMVTPQGVKMIEMAGRPGGGHIFGAIVEAVSGVSMPQALTQILLGEEIDPSARYSRGACYKFFNAPTGIFESVEHVSDARKKDGIIDLGFTMEPGTEVRTMDHGANRPGFVVSHGENRTEAIRRAEAAFAALKFNMR